MPRPAAVAQVKRRRVGRRVALTLVALVVAGLLGAGLGLVLHGYRVYVVHTGSMEPNYLPGDIVVDAPVAADDYHRGDVLTFRHDDRTTDVVTHRVASVSRKGLISTKGDANRSADAWQIRPDQVAGKTVADVRWLGYVLVFLKQPAGVASIATGVAGIVLLWELFFDESLTAAEPADRRRPMPFPRPVHAA